MQGLVEPDKHKKQHFCAWASMSVQFSVRVFRENRWNIKSIHLLQVTFPKKRRSVNMAFRVQTKKFRIPSCGGCLEMGRQGGRGTRVAARSYQTEARPYLIRKCIASNIRVTSAKVKKANDVICAIWVLVCEFWNLLYTCTIGMNVTLLILIEKVGIILSDIFSGQLINFWAWVKYLIALIGRSCLWVEGVEDVIFFIGGH